ncbi:MAG TPA: hypothetical protein VIJ46_03860, partial [Rhabdochlamydiaceae bacterium]
MSIYAVEQYIKEVEKLKRFGGTSTETALENAVNNLLNEYCKQKGFHLIKVSKKTDDGKLITPDGTIKDSLRLDWGYWESKDEFDDLEEEIKSKFRKGYPKDNILFEDKTTAILYQNGNRVGEVSMDDAAALDNLLTTFLNYERPEVRNFRDAIKKFKEEVPHVADALRDMILTQTATNKPFRAALEKFWDLCKESINPAITQDDVRE